MDGETETLPELLPCPHCGSTDVALHIPYYSSLWRGLCNDCGCEGPSAGTKESATTVWNERAEPAELARLRAENDALRQQLQVSALAQTAGADFMRDVVEAAK